MNGKNEQQRDMGVQPLDQVLTDLGISNPEVVTASTEQLTHKQVQKGRKGRRISENIQNKICRALNGAVSGDKQFKVGDLFNY